MHQLQLNRTRIRIYENWWIQHQTAQPNAFSLVCYAATRRTAMKRTGIGDCWFDIVSTMSAREFHLCQLQPATEMTCLLAFFTYLPTRSLVQLCCRSFQAGSYNVTDAWAAVLDSSCMANARQARMRVAETECIRTAGVYYKIQSASFSSRLLPLLLRSPLRVRWM